MTDDFSKAPQSIAELRADKSDKATDWTPRDALIKILRDIDSGDKNITKLVVVYLDEKLDDTGFQTAGTLKWDALAMLALANHSILTDD